MKVLRVLFTSTLMLTLITGVAQAAAPDRAVGFVQVLSHVDASIPVEVQSQRAFAAIMPQVLEAQARGQILLYETSRSTGVLKLVYRPSMSAPDIAGRKIYADMGQAIALVDLPRLESPSPAQGDVKASANPGKFNMTLFDSYFTGTGLPAGARVLGNLRNAAGLLLATSEGTADGTGYLASYFTWLSPSTDVFPGYKITFRAYNGSTLLYTYSITAPGIRFTSIDKANSIVKGTGPAGKAFYAYWSHSLWNSTHGSIGNAVAGTVSGAGTWTADFGTNPVHGGDYLYAYVTMNTNFQFVASMYVPYILCRLGGSSCQVTGFRFAPAALHIIHGGASHDYSGHFDKDGVFWVFVQTSSGTPIILAAGDKVSGTSVAQWTLPTFTASIAYSTDVVSGKAPASRYFYIYLSRQEPYGSFYLYSHANSAGNYATDFTSKVDLVSGAPYVIDIYFQLPTTGNATDFYKIISP